MDMAIVTEKTRVILVSLPGMLQRVLEDTLASQSGIEVMGVASGGLSAIEMLRVRQPKVLLVDTNIPLTEAIILIEMVKERYPTVKCVALVEISQDQQLLLNAGADNVLPAYQAPEQLLGILHSEKNRFTEIGN